MKATPTQTTMIRMRNGSTLGHPETSDYEGGGEGEAGFGRRGFGPPQAYADPPGAAEQGATTHPN